ncbi:MAG: DEAD/DEAH box helicase family protein [Blastocatellia bacterium]|nr:DEAD/DEAH box helicase family protein [Blastocatellia bacterium]
MNSNFLFLGQEWPEMFESATKAETLVRSDPRTSCFYTRRALELAVHWLYKSDSALKLPHSESLSALVYEPTFRNQIGSKLLTKAVIVKNLGNQAVHSHKPIQETDAIAAIRELFHFCFWIARTYARGDKPPDGIEFSPELLPRGEPASHQSAAQLQALEEQLRQKDEKLAELLEGKQTLDEELEKLRKEVAAAKKANAAQPDTHDYSEEQTRDYFIDLLLKEAGWLLTEFRDREYPVSGMPNQAKEGFVDYVLWGDDGKPLGLVEAKRTKRDARVGQQQAKLYADCLEAKFGQRPVIFYSNGYQHWMWDDTSHPPRPVQGFYKKSELELLIQRRMSRKQLANAEISKTIVERYYQTRAIRRVCEAFERDNSRKALLVMATGAGKTRTVIALCDLLMRCNWAKRILFLADRVALVNQALNAFKQHLPDSSPVNLVTEKDKEGRVYVSTYPTMMGLIDQAKGGQKRFGPGHFDLVIIDEAHRSVYQKYRAIFEYFDSYLVGLTATPKDEVDHNTYSLFELQDGAPTDAYPLEDAVKDGFLVPMKAVSVPLKFQREGIKYDDLSEEEKEEWDAKEWSEDGQVPDRVEAEAVNKWLFNKDTVDKVLEHLMTRGQKVAGGDRLGKTIIFAKNHAHAVFIGERFDANYPEYKGDFARLIDFSVEYAQSLIDSFSISTKAPHIAISVDMLDTGIDVPEIVNLVFFKLVRSKTKFWQMIGRGTRLRPDLFAPDQDKAYFYVFDYCKNLEFFSQDVKTVDGSSGESLSTRLFKLRLELISELDKERHETLTIEEEPERELREATAEFLRGEIVAMNVDNFIVRPRRELVERFAEAKAWEKLSQTDLLDLGNQVAGLPSQLKPEDEEAKRFDVLMLNLQLAVLRSEPRFTSLQKSLRTIAELLEEKSSIPMVQQQMPLIQEIQTDDWWQYVTPQMLETARKRLRLLVKLIDKSQRKPIYTDFADVMGDEKEVAFTAFAKGDDYEQFRAKARRFLHEHENHIAIHKLKMNEPLTKSDLAELQTILVESGIGTSEDIQKATEESDGLGLFVRSLIGLDREAAKQALGGFTTGKTLKANQIEFLDLIVNHLTERGVVKVEALYESPYTDVNQHGPDGLFPEPQVEEIVSILHDVRERAVA